MILLTDTMVMAKILIAASISLLAGGGLSYFLWNLALNKKKQRIISEAFNEGEAQKRDKLLQAKEKFLQLKTEHEKYINEKNSKINATENRLNQRKIFSLKKIEEQQRARNELEAIRENMNVQLALLDKRTEEMEKLHRQQVEQLETISGISAEEAKNQLIESLREEAKTQAISYVNEIMAEAKMTAAREAKKLVVETIQRVASETALKIQSPCLTLKAMRLRAVLSEGKVGIFERWKPPQVWRLLLMIHRRRSFYQLLTRCVEKSHVYLFTSWSPMAGYTPPALRKLLKRQESRWRRKLWRWENAPPLIWASMVCIRNWSVLWVK